MRGGAENEMANAFTRLANAALNEKVGSITSPLIEEYAAYGLTEDQVEALDDANALFEANIALQLQKEALKLAATEATQAQRSVLLFMLSELVDQIYANPTVSDEALLKIGLAARPVRTVTTPTPALNVSATVKDSNNVEIKWNRNGNIPSTKFTIQTRSETGAWTLFAVITGTKYTFQTTTPGVAQYFRVQASRGKRISAWSNEAAIWATEDGGNTDLSLAA